ncbi:hypothetical protein Tco_1129745 [Tanacetum coccineum]
MRHICNWKGHSVVHEDEEAAIPLDFVTANDLVIFEQAKIVYGKKSYRLELHREFYNDDLSRVSDMKLVGNWRRISRCCMFGKNKTIRLKYLANMLDKRVVKTCGQDPVMNHYVPIYKEIEVYIEKNTMEVVLGTGKGVVIEEVVEDDKVKEASKTGNSGKQLFLDFSYETLEMKNEVKAEQEMEEPVHNDFHPLMYEDDLLQKDDPVNYQQDPYHGKDEVE